MTRRERMLTQAHKERSVSEELAFQRGAEWADNNPNWVSVDERLPEEKDNEESDMVLVTDGERMFHGHYWFRINDWISLVRKPTHWMPLPNKPKGETI